MNTKSLLTIGWISAIAFISGSLLLGSLQEGYSHLSQTVSEIGKIGSPMRWPWQIFSTSIGILLLGFGIGIVKFSGQRKLSVLPGIFMLSYGLSHLLMSCFPSPHTLHNVFGLSLTIGYMSPLVFALSWGNKLGSSFKRASWLAFIVVALGITLNLSPLFNPTLYPLSYYGIVQRLLIFSFFLYCAYVGVTTRSHLKEGIL